MASKKQVTLMTLGFKSDQNNNKPPALDKSKPSKDVSKDTKIKVSKKNYEDLKRKRDYQKSWETEFHGLKFDPEVGMTCTFCTQYKELAGASVFINGCKTFRKGGIQYHWESQRHLMAANAAANVVEGRGPLDRIVRRIGEENKQVIMKMFNTAYFVLHYEMPFTSFPNLLNLQAKNGSDLQRLLSYSSDMACRRFTEYIVKAIREPVLTALSDVDVLSIMFDGATDSSISEVEIIYCRYLERGQPHDVFVALADIQHAHADGVFEAINHAMTDLAGDDWLRKLIGVGCDGASVNLGNRNSVATRLRAEERDYIIPVHCVAHRLELSVLSAIKDHPHLTTINDMLKKIYKHYHYSPKALRELRAVAETMEEKIIKPTRLHGTRWLPHIRKASTALIASYSVILTHFQHVGEAGPNQATPEVRGRARFLTQKLLDFRVLRFLFFMRDVLEVVSALSLSFQKDGQSCCDYLDAYETAVLEMTELSQEPGDHLTGFLEEVSDEPTGHFRGFELTHYDDNIDYANLRQVCETIRDRLTARFEDQNQISTRVLSAGRVFDTKEWPVERDGLIAYGNDSVVFLTEHFAPVLRRMNMYDPAAIRTEWTRMKAVLGARLQQHPRPTVNDLFVTHPELLAHILKLAKIVLTIPVSSSVCERGFSAVKRIKSDWRSSLTTAQMNNLLVASMQGPSLEQYDAERAVHLWWSEGQRERRPQFAAAQAQPNPDQEDELLAFLLGAADGQ